MLELMVVSEHFGVKPDDITSKKRNAEFVLPRQIIMYLCRKLTDTSYTSIAKLLNKKDHTTVIHGCSKIEAEVATNKELQNKIEIIEKKINRFMVVLYCCVCYIMSSSKIGMGSMPSKE